MYAALIMGRAGSKGVPHKNIRPLLGVPLSAYPMRAARAAKKLDRIYVSTDCSEIKRQARLHDLHVIDRPDALSQSHSEMLDVILHALEIIGPVEIMVTMHANVATHSPGLIDECITRLEHDPKADSCVSVRFVEDLHPYRQKKVSDGWLTPWVKPPESVGNNRQSIAEKSVVLDGACRAWRPDRCIPARGQPPFRYLGNRIAFVENEGGRDVNSEEDFVLSEQWLLRRQAAH